MWTCLPTPHFPITNPLKSTSAINTLNNISVAPKYPFPVSVSPVKTKANPAEKTGSNEKIRPVCIGVVYCWAITCTMNATAVQKMLKINMMSHESIVLGSFGVSIMNEK